MSSTKIDRAMAELRILRRLRDKGTVSAAELRVLARPTVSLVLYQQIVGRGLRGLAFGGTETCVILNCIDRVKIGPVVLARQAFRELWREASSEP